MEGSSGLGYALQNWKAYPARLLRGFDENFIPAIGAFC